MKNKRFTAKILIDIGMTICLLLLMPYSLLSETAHEWIGMAMLVLFISHYILNHKWVTSVRKSWYISTFQNPAGMKRRINKQ